MGDSLRIAIAEDEVELLQFYEVVAVRLGHKWS